MTVNKKRKTKGNIEKAGRASKNMDYIALNSYIKEIEKIPLLTREDEEEIARLAALGDKAAGERLVNANLRFVVMIAKKFQGRGLPLEDLVSEGNVGILNALKYFDPDRGYRFISYAVWWIRQSILKAIHEKGRMIKLPASKSKALAKAERDNYLNNDNLINQLNPGIDEFADILKLNRNKAASLYLMGKTPISLDDTLKADPESLSIVDNLEDYSYVSPDDEAIDSILKQDIKKALSSLSKRDADIIRSHYGIGGNKVMTLKEIGERYNLTRERVRQIESRILGRLKNMKEWKNLRAYTA